MNKKKILLFALISFLCVSILIFIIHHLRDDSNYYSVNLNEMVVSIPQQCYDSENCNEFSSDHMFYISEMNHDYLVYGVELNHLTKDDEDSGLLFHFDKVDDVVVEKLSLCSVGHGDGVVPKVCVFVFFTPEVFPGAVVVGVYFYVLYRVGGFPH